MSGVRSVKIADGLRHEYVTQNGRVVRESVYGLNSNTGEYTVFQYALDFVYDESGHPFLMRRYYNEAQTNYNTYHYVLNAQGDVIKLLHGQNTTVAEYTYDAWGNVLTATGSLADVNPLRYRGYYFDAETGFYYLQSRYYDPVVKRFLNADSYASTGQGFLGYNMFAYCNNCPFAGSDPSGTAIQNNLVICNDGNNNQYGDRCEIVPREYCIGYYYDVEDAINNTEKAITKAEKFVEDNWKSTLDLTAWAIDGVSIFCSALTTFHVAALAPAVSVGLLVAGAAGFIWTGGRLLKIW